MAVDGRKLKKPLKGLGKNAQGKNMDLESSGKPEFVEDDTGPEKLTMSNPIKDTVNELSVLYEEKMEQAVERAAEMAAMKVAETMIKEINNLKEQLEDKDEKIARLESEKNDLLHEKTQNESTIKENQLKIDTLMQEKITLEMELQKNKINAEIELEKVRKN